MMMKNIRNMGWTTVEFDRELQPIGFSGFDKRLFFGIEIENISGKPVSALLAEADDKNEKQIHFIIDSLRRARQEKRSVYLEYTSTLPTLEKVRVTGHAACGDEKSVYLQVMEVNEDDLLRSREVDRTVAVDRESHALFQTIYGIQNKYNFCSVWNVVEQCIV